ncbi:DUF1810 domain-containing protein [Aureimonas sp. ME7]|uniref:DUF1810 domain-containing protein n=1 Tax=Aureimonas sp. ME7 TaxID=2744252 RepID=UPI0015F7399F|nr:DUF1810 domain-containing protein [Aureimonas sp. ME7]
MSDPYRLQRFLDAQDPVIDTVMAELRAGHKRSHWMWFVFPQIAGLGRSATAQHFALSSLAEAKAYLDHALLGERLRRCTAAVNAVAGRSVHDIFGSPDDMKFHSSMTLFRLASNGDPVFAQALAAYFGGRDDEGTLVILRTAAD